MRASKVVVKCTFKKKDRHVRSQVEQYCDRHNERTMRVEQSLAFVRDYVLDMNSEIFTQVQVDDDIMRKDRAPPKRSKTVVLAKMQKLHHLKQISELNTPVEVIFNGNH